MTNRYYYHCKTNQEWADIIHAAALAKIKLIYLENFKSYPWLLHYLYNGDWYLRAVPRSWPKAAKEKVKDFASYLNIIKRVNK